MILELFQDDLLANLGDYLCFESVDAGVTWRDLYTFDGGEPEDQVG
jgi:hypothetical protein